jgi:hypothetical protein
VEFFALLLFLFFALQPFFLFFVFIFLGLFLACVDFNSLGRWLAGLVAILLHRMFDLASIGRVGLEFCRRFNIC